MVTTNYAQWSDFDESMTDQTGILKTNFLDILEPQILVRVFYMFFGFFVFGTLLDNLGYCFLICFLYV